MTRCRCCSEMRLSARSQCGSKQRRADHTCQFFVHSLIEFHFYAFDMLRRMANPLSLRNWWLHKYDNEDDYALYISSVIVWKMTILLSHWWMTGPALFVPTHVNFCSFINWVSFQCILFIVIVKTGCSMACQKGKTQSWSFMINHGSP